MSSEPDEFLLDYQYAPAPEAEERMAEAWELILALILEDLEDKQETNSEGEPC